MAQYEDDLDNDLDAAQEGAAEAQVPVGLKGLRACIPCMLVKTYDQFYEEGCENCKFLELNNDGQKCKTCTTADFDGFVSMCEPKASWVARWMRTDELVPGCYAIRVNADLPHDVEEDLVELGVRNRGKLSKEDQ
jgi:transcription elongation factor SPT4